MKQIVIILIFMCTSMLVESQTLTGGVVYTVESAREAAFSGIEYEISMEPYKEYMKDPGFTAGEGGKKARISKRGRRVTVFSNGNYGVTYKENLEIGYYYTTDGVLEYIQIRKNNYDYPVIFKTYDIYGKLCKVSYKVAWADEYVYYPNKTLVGHWIDDYFYDEKGIIKSKRKF